MSRGHQGDRTVEDPWYTNFWNTPLDDFVLYVFPLIPQAEPHFM